jgi:MATE family multidrug resistance protein
MIAEPAPLKAPGEAPLGHRDVLAIAVPIMLSNFTTPLIGIVDTAALGQLSDPRYIGAVAVGAMIFNMIYWAFGFLRMGTTGLTAQAYGAGPAAEVAATLLRALLIAGIAGATLIVLQIPIALVAFKLVPGSEGVEAGAETYFAIRIWSAPAALANYALLGWFIGLGRAGTAFALQLVLNLTNAALDALLVLVMGMDVVGVAIGTVAAETLAAVCGLYIAWRAVGGETLSALTRAHVLESKALKRMLAVNRDIMVRTLCLLFAFSWFTAQSAKGGDVVLAANAVLFSFFSFSAYFLDGFAFASEALVGQAIGAGRRRRFVDAIRLSSLWAAAFSLGLSLFLALAGSALIDLMTVSPEVRTAARGFLIWAAIAPIAGVAAFQLDGIFIGATRTADMRNMMILSLAVYLAAWAVLTPAFGNHGLWASVIVFFLIRAASLGIRFPALVRNAFPAPA